VLIEPASSATTTVQLPGAYTRMSLVTDVLGSGAASSVDVALLWGSGASGVALWSLGLTSGTPYRSVETLNLDAAVSDVVDVQGAHPELKILKSSSANAFYVLDLKARTAAPLLTTDQAVDIELAPDGNRAWAYSAGTTDVAWIDLTTLHPKSLLIDRLTSAVYDVARLGGGRAMIAVHDYGTVGATVYDATAPDDTTARLYSALLAEGL
jgi:hypothetical protein